MGIKNENKISVFYVNGFTCDTYFFPLDTIADVGSAPRTEVLISIGILSIAVGIICVGSLLSRKRRAFLKEHRKLLSSEDPQVLLELSKKCDDFLKGNSLYCSEVVNLAHQAKTKAAEIEKQIDHQENLEIFKSEISEDGSHPAVVSTLKEQMHNPDSFQHVSSEYGILNKDNKRYHKIVMTFRGRNTFNALVLQTCYFLVDEDNQISLVGSPDDSESSPVNTEQLSASIETAASAFESIASAADLLLFFSSEE